jgi:hypothetical protein
MKLAFIFAFWSIFATQNCLAQKATATSSPDRSVTHFLRLAAIQETGQHVAIMDERIFATVDGLKQYIRSLRGGDMVLYSDFDDPSPENPFRSAARDISKTCEEKNLQFSKIIYD